MKRNRNENQDEPTRASSMKQADGSRESVRNSGAPGDLGTSSDRAMFDERVTGERGSGSSPERDSAMSNESSSSSGERGRGSSGERNRGNAGGISNREMEQERAEQEQLPERGHSQSER